jgi:hypothetical protein
VYVDFDTGSSELWVNPTCANSWYPAGCAANGYYNPAMSSTSQSLTTNFSIGYGIGTVSGRYVVDTVRMGNVDLLSTQFGNATTSTRMMQGILGVGLGFHYTTSYNTIIDQLVAQGVIPSKAFSVYLDSIDAPQGSMTFGAMDTKKFTGGLQKLPIVSYKNAPEYFPRYWVKLDGMGITPPGNSSSVTLTNGSQITLIPDSGSTFSYLPPNVVNAMLPYFPGYKDNGDGYYLVDCLYRNQPGSLQFTFGGVVITVSYHEFIWFDGGRCWLAAVPSSNPYILGDSFMRSAYCMFKYPPLHEPSNFLSGV